MIEAACLAEDNDYNLTLTRLKLEQLCDSIWLRCIPPLALVLKDANLEKGTIDEVILVGGSTRIPKVQQLLTDFFDGK